MDSPTSGFAPIGQFGRRLAILLASGMAACSEAPSPAGLLDASVTDSAIDVGRDASFDEGLAEPLPSGCFITAPLGVHRAPEPVASFAFAGGTDDFLVAYTVGAAGGRDVLVRRLDSGHTLHAALRVTSQPGENSQLALAATAEGWVLAYSSMQEDVSRVLGQHLSPAALALDEAPAAPHVLADLGSSSPTFGRTGEHVMLAYRGEVDDVVGAYQRRLTPDGKPSGDASLVALDDVGAVRAIGGSSGFFVAWSDSDGRVLGRSVTSNSLGATIALNQGDPSPTGAFELGYSGATFSALTGVAELDVRTVRFRHITASGSLLGQPRLLPYQGGEYATFSVARFAAGFAVAYRHAELGRHQLRILLLDLDGNDLFQTALTSLYSGDGDIAIRQSTDGGLAILWSDFDASGESVLRVSGVRCTP
jgi:hypothetical protein